MINYVQDYIQGNNLSTNESKVFGSNNNKYQIAPLNKQNDDENNDISTIDISECEQKIRKYYSIPNNEELLLLKIDAYKEGYNMAVVEYELYRYKTGEKLELNICNGMTCDISVPTNSVNENKWPTNILNYINNTNLMCKNNNSMAQLNLTQNNNQMNNDTYIQRLNQYNLNKIHIIDNSNLIQNSMNNNYIPNNQIYSNINPNFFNQK